MIESFLADLDTILLVVFAACALVGAALMLVLREPMGVATALISTMVFLGGIYGLLGVHFIAAFQVLIYVGAVMVFMVYVIMLLDPHAPAARGRYSKLVLPGCAGAALLIGTLGHALWSETPSTAARGAAEGFTLAQFATAFLNEYWLHFELTSVLLAVAVVAAIAVIKVSREQSGNGGRDG